MMKPGRSWRDGRLFIMVAWLLVLLLQGQEAYAGKKVSGTGKVVAVRSQTRTVPGDVPNHEITTTTRLDVFASDDPDWNGVPASFVAYADLIAGTGPHWGYLVVTHPGGDQTYHAYEGVGKRIVNPDGSWEANLEGRTWLIGGTGRFRGITGSGTYKGKATPAGVTYEWEAEYEVRK